MIYPKKVPAVPVNARLFQLLVDTLIDDDIHTFYGVDIYYNSIDYEAAKKLLDDCERMRGVCATCSHRFFCLSNHSYVGQIAFIHGYRNESSKS